MKGCPLACRWCHNPESQSRTSPSSCAWRTGAWPAGGAPPRNGPGRWPGTWMGKTWKPAPPGRCSRWARTLEPDELVGAAAAGPDLLRRVGRRGDLLRRRAPHAARLPAGEPGAPAAREGVHTALDTCGFAPWGDAAGGRQASTWCSTTSSSWTRPGTGRPPGQSNRRILDNLKALCRVHPADLDPDPGHPRAQRRRGQPGGHRPVPGAPGGGAPGGPAALPPHRGGQVRPRWAGPTPCADLTPPPRSGWRPWPAVFRARGLATTLGGHP